MAPRSSKQQPVKAADLVEASQRVAGDDEPRDDAEQALDDDDLDDDLNPPGVAMEAAAELVAASEPQLPRAAPTVPTAPVVMAAVPYQPRVIYKPAADRHMSEMGPVATRNFTAVIRGTRVDVKMGAPRKRIPREVVDLMERSGVEFGIAAAPTPPPGSGASVVPRRSTEPPRARRTERRADEPERGFRRVQGIASQPGY